MPKIDTRDESSIAEIENLPLDDLLDFIHEEQAAVARELSSELTPIVVASLEGQGIALVDGKPTHCVYNFRTNRWSATKEDPRLAIRMWNAPDRRTADLFMQRQEAR